MKRGKICLVIKGPSYQEAASQIEQAYGRAELIELRLDLLESIDFEQIAQLKHQSGLPVIFALRDLSQGGSYKGSEEQRLSILFELGKLKPEYCDLESHIPKEWIDHFSSTYPEITTIISHHNLSETPLDIEAVYQQMKETKGSIYKLAFMARSTLDTMRLLRWTHQKKESLITVSMGDLGQSSRILGPVVGSLITYSCLDEKHVAAPGQLTADQLKDIYHYEFLNEHTAIYGLIGDNVTTSISHMTHNSLLERLGENAVYVKFPIAKHEVPDFLKEIRFLPFKGLSVTIPLKEVVINCLQEIDDEAKQIGAVNTLVIKDGKTKGYNTDCLGALNAIEKEAPVKGLRTIILGAGGAAKAIAFEATQRGAKLTILNRDVEKAKRLAEMLECEYGSLDDCVRLAQEGYELLINSTPLEMPIDSNGIVPGSIVMDIKTRAFDTPLLQEAEARGCRIVYGYEMFVEQAVEQFLLWFGQRLSRDQYHEFLREKSLSCLS